MAYPFVRAVNPNCTIRRMLFLIRPKNLANSNTLQTYICCFCQHDADFSPVSTIKNRQRGKCKDQKGYPFFSFHLSAPLLFCVPFRCSGSCRFHCDNTKRLKMQRFLRTFINALKTQYALRCMKPITRIVGHIHIHRTYFFALTARNTFFLVVFYS